MHISQSIKDNFNPDYDKHIYAINELPLITVYDDNLFVRNDYDLLSSGQRQHLISFFTSHGFKQISGREMRQEKTKVNFPKPNRMLAQPQFDEAWLNPHEDTIVPVTPTAFAEALFYMIVRRNIESLDLIKSLIDKCPYNIELLRDISYRTEIESITNSSFKELTDYQKLVIEEKFKRKKAL